ncbi:hypothetical protein [Haladaptatus sp. DFWS20]|uniref:hypothetical protein n=1 Tax=Haladaptatus sp. DFWS20 TaxID=3403467 RepID=UPI003EBCC148
MNRRTLFTTVVSVAAVGSGCVSNAGSKAAENRESRGVKSQTFTVTNSNPNPPFDENPVVEFDAKKRQAVITGKMWKGNPCKVAEMKSVRYDPENRGLTVVVGVRRTKDWIKQMTGCADSLGAIRYEVVISFNDSLPRTVTATERPPKDFKQQTTTVEHRK